MNPGRLALVLSRRELLPWTLAGCALGLVEGATAAVLPPVPVITADLPALDAALAKMAP